MLWFPDDFTPIIKFSVTQALCSRLIWCNDTQLLLATTFCKCSQCSCIFRKRRDWDVILELKKSLMLPPTTTESQNLFKDTRVKTENELSSKHFSTPLSSSPRHERQQFSLRSGVTAAKQTVFAHSPLKDIPQKPLVRRSVDMRGGFVRTVVRHFKGDTLSKNVKVTPTDCLCPCCSFRTA